MYVYIEIFWSNRFNKYNTEKAEEIFLDCFIFKTEFS